MKSKSAFYTFAGLAVLSLNAPGARAQNASANPGIRSAPSSLTFSPPAAAHTGRPGWSGGDPYQQLCLRDAPTHRLVCHTREEWRRIGIMRSAKDNFRAKTMK